MMRRILVGLLTLLLALPLAAADKKKKKKKAVDPYENSKYKSYKVLTPDEDHVYRYDERGNPIRSGDAKKKAKKKKVSSEEEEPKPDCAEGETCGETPKAD